MPCVFRSDNNFSVEESSTEDDSDFKVHNALSAVLFLIKYSHPIKATHPIVKHVTAVMVHH